MLRWPIQLCRRILLLLRACCDSSTVNEVHNLYARGPQASVYIMESQPKVNRQKASSYATEAATNATQSNNERQVVATKTQLILPTDLIVK